MKKKTSKTNKATASNIIDPGTAGTPHAEDGGFAFVFGPRPFGPRDFTMKQKQQAWDFEKSRFEHFEDLDWPPEALALYAEVGIGMPVAYRRHTGTDPHMQPVVVAFPSARYAKLRYVPLSTAMEFPGVVWRTWLLQSVAEGHYVPDLETIMPGLPGEVTNRNEANKPAA